MSGYNLFISKSQPKSKESEFVDSEKMQSNIWYNTI